MTAARRIVPGFGLSLGIALAYLGAIVVLPLAALAWQAARLRPAALWATLGSERTLAAFALSVGAAVAAAAVSTACGVAVAWVLVRYRFWGRALVDAVVDLPFALPTAVAGIALCATWGPRGPLGRPLAALGVASAYSRLGIVIALVFVGVPFVVRAVQPVLASLDPRLEEAAATLGASPAQAVWRVVLPALRPAIATGFALAFARGLGEYGSVVFISGNLPGRTEIAPLLIMAKLDQFDYPAATALAIVLLAASLAVLVGVHALGRRRPPRATPPPAAQVIG